MRNERTVHVIVNTSFFDREIHLIDMLLLGIRKQNLACFQYFLLYLLSWFPAQNITAYIRVGKTGSFGPWSRVIMYCSKLSFCQNDPPMGESFWQKESLLQYTTYDSAPRQGQLQEWTEHSQNANLKI